MLKAYVMVCVNGLIVDDVKLFLSEKAAKREFYETTGVRYNDVYGESGNYELMDEYYDQTKIFDVDLMELFSGKSIIKTIVEKVTEGLKADDEACFITDESLDIIEKHIETAFIKDSNRINLAAAAAQ